MEVKTSKRISLVTLAFIALTVFVITGCSEDRALLTQPADPGIIPFDLVIPEAKNVDLGNFAATGRGVTVNKPWWYGKNQPDYTIGYFFDITGTPPQLPWLQMNVFWVYMAKAGQYLLQYETMYGVFYILFEQVDRGAIAIYMHPRDVAYNITVSKGRIIADLPMVWEGANTMVYGELPYKRKFPEGIFVPKAVTPLVMNLIPNPRVGICPIPLDQDCYPWR